jgi:hypothetical protein
MMKGTSLKGKGQKAAFEVVEAFRKVGAIIGHELHRVVLHRDGGGEVEFNSPIPWECLVLRWEDPSGLTNLLDQIGAGGKAEGSAAIRKKCTKCFMHEKRIELGDLKK